MAPGTAAEKSKHDYQGGKAFGKLKAAQDNRLEVINKEFLEDEFYQDVDDLAEKLERYKEKFLDFDLNDEEEIDLMALKKMLERVGTPRTHLELKKIIAEVTTGNSDCIGYRDFLTLMLGKRSAVLKLIMLFEGRGCDGNPKPSGPPPKRDLASLP
ncbi:allograft inflammatory factor 1-like [Petromyzon marinus]|uniref:Allograft inflammatory factor 1-like n=1 Tax=Petromyzon marinus TaxID=7757 RepID=A0AAJ7TB78_PETMA|nr:allograft inflammatory factor 1-like [Petromyzon marinus]